MKESNTFTVICEEISLLGEKAPVFRLITVEFTNEKYYASSTSNSNVHDLNIFDKVLENINSIVTSKSEKYHIPDKLPYKYLMIDSTSCEIREIKESVINGMRVL